MRHHVSFTCRAPLFYIPPRSDQRFCLVSIIGAYILESFFREWFSKQKFPCVRIRILSFCAAGANWAKRLAASFPRVTYCSLTFTSTVTHCHDNRLPTVATVELVLLGADALLVGCWIAVSVGIPPSAVVPRPAPSSRPPVDCRTGRGRDGVSAETATTVVDAAQSCDEAAARVGSRCTDGVDR